MKKYSTEENLSGDNEPCPSHSGHPGKCSAVPVERLGLLALPAPRRPGRDRGSPLEAVGNPHISCVGAI